MSELSEDERFLVLMRKTLAAVAKDTAPTAGRPHLLKNSTIQMMRECFASISQREHSYRQQDNRAKKFPAYKDRPAAQVVQFVPHKKGEEEGKA